MVEGLERWTTLSDQNIKGKLIIVNKATGEAEIIRDEKDTET